MKKLSKELLINGISAIVIIIISLILIRVADFSSVFSNNQASDLSSVVAIGTAALATAVFLSMLCVIVPIVMVVAEFLLTLIARLFNIGEDKHWKHVVGHIFFIPALIIHLLLILLFLYIILSIKAVIYIIPLLISIIVFVYMIITYAKKAEK